MKYMSGVVSLEYDKEKCRRCGRCIEACPHAVFSMADGDKAKRDDRDARMECGVFQKSSCCG